MLFMKNLPRGQFTYTMVGMPLLTLAILALAMTRHSYFPVGVAVVMVTVCIPCVIAVLHRVKAQGVSPTHRRIEIGSPAAPDTVFARLRNASFDKLKLRDSDAARRVLVLEAPATGWSWGFHIPIFVRDAGIGSTIEIGIMPKMIQHVSTVEHWHEKAAAEIERALKA